MTVGISFCGGELEIGTASSGSSLILGEIWVSGIFSPVLQPFSLAEGDLGFAGITCDVAGSGVVDKVTEGGRSSGETMVGVDGGHAGFSTGNFSAVSTMLGLTSLLETGFGIAGFTTISLEEADFAAVTTDGDSDVVAEVVALASLLGGPGISAGGLFWLGLATALSNISLIFAEFSLLLTELLIIVKI